MKYLEDEQLTTLTSELTDASLGDSRVINGRIEAYTMKRAGTDKKYAHALGERYVAEMELEENQLKELLIDMPKRKRSFSAGGQLETSPPPPAKLQRLASPPRRQRAASFDSVDSSLTHHPSALGDFHEIKTRRLMTDLILTLNASFPDYDFGDVRPTHFNKVPLELVVRTVNKRLSLLKKQDFLRQLWSAIDQVMSTQDCTVYTYVSSETSFLTQTLARDDDTTPLWTFNYFFVNKHKKRILLFCCVETMQLDDNDEYVEQDVTKSVGYSADLESNFDLDPAADVAGGIPIDV